jgi:DNA-binding NarL/FixJ family response regulator
LNAAEILIVEDDEVIMGALAYNLSQEGYGVKGATTGAEALRLARKLRLDLILLYIVLPGESGIEVCGRIPAIGYVAVARGRYRLSSSNFEELRVCELQLLRIPKRRSSQNTYSTHSGE